MIPLLFAGIALGTLSRSLDNSWLFLLACLMLGVIVASFVTRPRLGRLDFALESPRRAMVGAQVGQVLVVTATRRGAGAAVVVLHGPGLAPALVAVPAMPAGGVARLPLFREALARCAGGDLHLLVRGSDAFGLLRSSRTVAVDVPVLIHPRPAPPLVVAPSSATVGAGADVVGVRPWRVGDPATAVHARASARRGQLVVLEREVIAPRTLVLLLDGGSTGTPGGTGTPVTDAVGAQAWEDTLARCAALVRNTRDRAVVLVSVDVEGGVGVARGPGLLDAIAVLPTPGKVTPDVFARARRLAGSDGQVAHVRVRP